jgi:hypothetical protein
MAVRDSVKHIGAVQRSCIKLLYVKNVCGLMTELLICSHSSPLFSSPHPPLFNPPPLLLTLFSHHIPSFYTPFFLHTPSHPLSAAPIINNFSITAIYTWLENLAKVMVL